MAKQTGVLARDEIFAAIRSGEVSITPFQDDAVGVASVDLTLGDEFRFFTSRPQGVVDITEDTDYKNFTEKIQLAPGEPFVLLPGQTCLGITRETIRLSPGICGLLEGRSRFARMGLFVHITAGFIQPGVENQQVLEIFNASLNALALHPGTRVCQFIFMRMIGEAKYTGKYNAQEL